jgi:acyl carrier protein
LSAQTTSVAALSFFEVNPMPLRSTIIEEFKRVASEHDKPIIPFSDETSLLDSGLDSLCFAILVARLEDALGVDPFETVDEAAFPATVGEFIGLYERAVR